MNRTIRSLTILLLAPLAALSAAGATPAQPNILLLYADDLGYADLSCQVSRDVKTPQIDSLAAGGVRCTAGYVTAPQCSPSRAGLMSGRYQQRFGHESNANFPLMLMRGGCTIADPLRAAGYATGHFGKWHLGFSDLGSAPPEIRDGNDQMLPTQHGFAESFGYPEYGKAARKGSDIEIAPHAYDDRVFARKAADFIARHRDAPWFAYVAFHAPHTQHVDFGGYKASFPDAPKDRIGVVSVMAQQDAAVGILLAKLRELGLEENTLIFYISDNGGTRRSKGETKHFTGSLNTPFSGDKGTALEGGIRVPFIVQWKGSLPAGRIYDRPVITLDVMPTALAVAKAAPPAGLPLDGVNLMPFLLGNRSGDPHEVLFWRWHGEQAIRMGDFKLVHADGQKTWRLIDIAKDLEEERDLTKEHPDLAQAMHARFEKWNAALPPVGRNFKDTTEGEEGGERKGKAKK